MNLSVLGFSFMFVLECFWSHYQITFRSVILEAIWDNQMQT